MNSEEVSQGSRARPIDVACSSKRCQQATIALRGVPSKSAARWPDASAAIASATRSGASTTLKSRSDGGSTTLFGGR